ncbi:Fic family protein [Tenggerimyces flavus]|uniref:Fic family protein n=1 Tax=Tenggerimyces flavus TaxID=1708749 RepID=A0ABV7YD75_9ACTN|nr:Fic/DOC family N-terminal domain-containing protein [Tenggerimyces flavus]MBM7783576.1 Fic family protein [Tenggerimyces flavus]
MDLSSFTDQAPGSLVQISGTDPVRGEWKHAAFVPYPLPRTTPDLSPSTYRVVANARAELAALDSTARRLPNPRLFRRPSLQAEAQSTSALEGTYAPLAAVLTADEDQPQSPDLKEVLNFVRMADVAFGWIEQGRNLSVTMLNELQLNLVQGTANQTAESGAVRTQQVIVGRRKEVGRNEATIYASRFVPSPPGLDLQANLQGLLDWMDDDGVSQEVDPVVAAALAHYQFETLHPYHDGNGRIGRLLIVVHLLTRGTLLEPTLTVSPWFETRRHEYYDRLFSVSAAGDWDTYVRFFATGLEASAKSTHRRMLALVELQASMKERVRQSNLRADTAHTLVDYAVAHVSFTVRGVERGLGISYGRANGLVSQLVDLGLLAPLPGASGAARRFYAPEVVDVIVGDED